MKPISLHRTYRTFALAFIFLAAALYVPAQTRADDAPKAPARTGKCMMWKVSSGTASVYLVGSIHFGTPDMYPLPKELEEAFAKSDLLVVEVDESKMDKAKAVQVLQERGMFKNGQTLSASLPKETLKALQDYCAQIGVPAQAIDQYKPWLLGMQLQVLAIQKLGFDHQIGIDMHFVTLATKSNKKIEELESMEFQLNLLSGFDLDLQAKALAAGLDEMKEMKQQMNDMKEAWIAGDVKRMNEVITKSIQKHPELADYQKKLIDDRNGPMAEKVEKYLKGDKTVFVIAGCAHMVGDQGIVKILQDHHFTVDQSTATPGEEKRAE